MGFDRVRVPADEQRCVERTLSGRRCELPRASHRGDGTRCNIHYHVAKRRENEAARRRG